MNQRKHEAWKKIFIRDQWNWDDFRDEYQILVIQSDDNDKSHVLLLGA